MGVHKGLCEERDHPWDPLVDPSLDLLQGESCVQDQTLYGPVHQVQSCFLCRNLACLQGERVLEGDSEDGGGQEGVDQEEGHEEGVDREGGRQVGEHQVGGHRGEGRQEGESPEEAKSPELLEEVEVFCTWELLVLETYSLEVLKAQGVLVRVLVGVLCDLSPR